MTKTHYATGFSAAQRRNLETLYAHLATVKPENFNMRAYARSKHDYELDPPDVLELIEKKNYCGTVACVAGHGPIAGIKPRKTEDSWDDYTGRVFGARSGYYASHQQYRNWDWLFSAAWALTDRTIAGARARIRIALDVGIPIDYERQIAKQAPLSYTLSPGAV